MVIKMHWIMWIGLVQSAPGWNKNGWIWWKTVDGFEMLKCWNVEILVWMIALKSGSYLWYSRTFGAELIQNMTCWAFLVAWSILQDWNGLESSGLRKRMCFDTFATSGLSRQVSCFTLSQTGARKDLGSRVARKWSSLMVSDGHVLQLRNIHWQFC